MVHFIAMKVIRHLYGKQMTAEVTVLDAGIHLLLTGGDRTHVGSISAADGEGVLKTICFQGHKEEVLSDLWAKEISVHTKQPSVVAAGIHYDHAKPEQIQEIIEVTEQMLQEIIELLARAGEK